MKRKEIVVCILSLTVAFTFFLPPVTYAQPTANTAPFWYGTESGYTRPLSTTLPYNPFFLDDGGASPPILRCSSSAPSIDANFQRNSGALFSFNNNPTGTRDLIFNIPEKSWDGYTLLSCMNGCAHPSKPGKMFAALLIDNDGAFIQGWENIKTFPARIWPGGYVTGSGTEGTVIESPALVKQDWCGNEVWRWDSNDYDMPGTQFHHDYQLEGNPVGYYAPPISPSENFLPKVNGSVLALANHVPENTYYYPKGWVPEGHPARDTSNISQFPLVDDAFYIINNKGQITWQWFACDHFEQMGFSEKAKDGIMNTRAIYTDRTDWTHFNNVNWLGPNMLHKKGDNRFNPSTSSSIPAT